MLGVFWNPQDLLLMMVTDIFNIDASWAEKLMKKRVSFLTAPTVCNEIFKIVVTENCHQEWT